MNGIPISILELSGSVGGRFQGRGEVTVGYVGAALLGQRVQQREAGVHAHQRRLGLVAAPRAQRAHHLVLHALGRLQAIHVIIQYT